MPQQVIMGAVLQCSFGMAPSKLIVLPVNRTIDESVPAANIMDHIPLVNIMPFGMCSSPANPTVAAATTAALGVLTPMPCIPATMAPWTPGSPSVQIAGIPALDSPSKCMCNWGGVVSVSYAGQVKDEIP